MAKSRAELLREAAAALERGQGAGLQQTASPSEPKVAVSESQPQPRPRIESCYHGKRDRSKYEEPSSSRQKNCNQEQQTLEARHRLDSQGVPSDDQGRHSHVSALDISGRRSPGRRCAALEDSGSDNSESRGSVLEARGRGSLESHDWKLEPDLKLAASKFRRNLLQEAEEQPELVARIDFTRDPQDREREMLTFYKRHDICWARPFSVILRGDSALGDGVARHLHSFVMSRVQFGFDLNLGEC
ncbi:hypothetical protein MHYP_G00269290 [Metynnis hypsauchen]